MRVPACHEFLKPVNHTAPSIQSAMPATTTAPQFTRIALPSTVCATDNILFRGSDATGGTIAGCKGSLTPRPAFSTVLTPMQGRRQLVATRVQLALLTVLLSACCPLARAERIADIRPQGYVTDLA